MIYISLKISFQSLLRKQEVGTNNINLFRLLIIQRMRLRESKKKVGNMLPKNSCKRGFQVLLQLPSCQKSFQTRRRTLTVRSESETD